MAYRNQDFRLGGCYPEVHKVFCARFRLQSSYINIQFFSTLWFDVEESLSFLYYLSIGFHGIIDLVFLQTGEVEAVLYLELTSFEVDSFEAYILVSILHFGHSRMRSTVRSYNAVTQEVTVAWCVDAEVTTIRPIFTAVLVHLEQTLVHPVPNVTALQVRIFIDGIPLSRQVTVGVTHSMRVFRWNNRTVAAFSTNFVIPCHIRILRNIHVGVPFPKGAFVVHRSVHTHRTGFLTF